MNENRACLELYVQENRRNGRKTCPSATLSTTNATLTGPGVSPAMGRRMEIVMENKPFKHGRYGGGAHK